MKNNRKLNSILVTGGCGFIGSNFIRYLFGYSNIINSYEKPSFNGIVVNVDKLTYAGNIENLIEVENSFGTNSKNNGNEQRYFFEHLDICDKEGISKILKKYNIDTIVNFAAESHVDRSISDPEAFIKTNVFGTFNLLNCAKEFWSFIDSDGIKKIRNDVFFHHISTDEVYGSLGNEGYFKEETAYSPRSPYSASKASSDQFVMAYYHTYNFPVTVSNCSNNYGPYQFPEKLIPLVILNIIQKKEIPVYGDGKNIRDWIYVEDHNNAVWKILREGSLGEKYNIGGENELNNIELIHKIINFTVEEIIKTNKNYSEEEINKLIKFIKDRPGHDRRYSIDCSKIKRELKWNRKVSFDDGLKETIKWYLKEKDWIQHIQNGEYKNWINKNYSNR